MQRFVDRAVSTAVFARSWSYFNDEKLLWPNLLECAREVTARIEPLEDGMLDSEELELSGKMSRRDAEAARNVLNLRKRLKINEILVIQYGYLHLLGPGHLGELIDGPDVIRITVFAPQQQFDSCLQRHDAEPVPLLLRALLYLLPVSAGERLSSEIATLAIDHKTEGLESRKTLRYLKWKYRNLRVPRFSHGLRLARFIIRTSSLFIDRIVVFEFAFRS